MKRTIYLLTGSSKNTRIMTCIALALALVSLSLVAYIGYNTIYGSVFDIPMLKLFISEVEIEEAEEELMGEMEDFEEVIDFIEEELPNLSREERKEAKKEFEEEYGMSIDEFKDLMDELKDGISLHSMMQVFEHIPDFNIASEFVIIKTAYQSLIGTFVFYGLLIALAALFLKRWIMIVEFVLAAGVYLAFGGPVMFVILLALLIAYCVLISNLNAEWKKHLRSLEFAEMNAATAEPVDNNVASFQAQDQGNTQNYLH